MITKHGLNVRKACAKHPSGKIGAIDCLRVEDDATLVGTDGHGLVALEGKKLKGAGVACWLPFNLHAGAAEELAKGLRKGEAAHVEDLDDVDRGKTRRVEFRVLDAEGQDKGTVTYPVIEGAFPDWRGMLAKAHTAGCAGTKELLERGIVVNRETLKRVLDAMDSCSPYPEAPPLWVRICGDRLILETRAYEDGRACLGAVVAMEGRSEDWVQVNQWADDVLNGKGAGKVSPPARKPVTCAKPAPKRKKLAPGMIARMDKPF